jgi:hypothetical protein
VSGQPPGASRDGADESAAYLSIGTTGGLAGRSVPFPMELSLLRLQDVLAGAPLGVRLPEDVDSRTSSARFHGVETVRDHADGPSLCSSTDTRA